MYFVRFPYCRLEGKRFLTEKLNATVVTGFVCLRYCIFFSVHTQRKIGGEKIKYHCIKEQVRSTCGARGCKAPIKNLDGPTRILQNIYDKLAENSPLNTRPTLPHPNFASVEPPRFQTPHFPKCVYMHDDLCNVNREHFITKDLYSWQRYLLHLCIHNLHTKVKVKVSPL